MCSLSCCFLYQLSGRRCGRCFVAAGKGSTGRQPTGDPAASPLSPAVPDPWDAEELCEEIEALKRREDVVTDGGYPERILANAPDTREGFFAVPKVVE